MIIGGLFFLIWFDFSSAGCVSVDVNSHLEVAIRMMPTWSSLGPLISIPTRTFTLSADPSVFKLEYSSAVVNGRASGAFQWWYLAGSFDVVSRKLSFFVNGRAAWGGDATVAAAVTSPEGPTLELGKGSAVSFDFVRFYSSVISESAFLAVYNNALQSLTAPPPTARIEFDTTVGALDSADSPESIRTLTEATVGDVNFTDLCGVRRIFASRIANGLLAIDGLLDECEWELAVREDFAMAHLSPAVAHMRLLHDTEFLYIAYEVDDPTVDDPPDAMTGFRTDVDSAQFYLGQTIHVVILPYGVRFSDNRTVQPSATSMFQRVATGWRLESRIPWSALDGLPALGSTVRGVFAFTDGLGMPNALADVDQAGLRLVGDGSYAGTQMARPVLTYGPMRTSCRTTFGAAPTTTPLPTTAHVTTLTPTLAPATHTAPRSSSTFLTTTSTTPPPQQQSTSLHSTSSVSDPIESLSSRNTNITLIPFTSPVTTNDQQGSPFVESPMFIVLLIVVSAVIVMIIVVVVAVVCKAKPRQTVEPTQLKTIDASDTATEYSSAPIVSASGASQHYDRAPLASSDPTSHYESIEPLNAAMAEYKQSQ